MTQKFIQKIVILMMLSLPMGACGVKPGTVSPPEGAETTQFPRTYPTSVEQ